MPSYLGYLLIEQIKIQEEIAKEMNKLNKAEKALKENSEPLEPLDQDDQVNHPSHYTNGSVECIEAIEAMMSPEAFTGYLRGNITKYLWRFDKKNGLQDLNKAQWYLNKLSEIIEAQQNTNG